MTNVYIGHNTIGKLREVLSLLKAKNIFLVTGKSSCRISSFSNVISRLSGVLSFIKYSDYSPNPKYSEIKKAHEVFKKNHCDCILAVGGGTAIDIAKCVNIMAADEENFLDILNSKFYNIHKSVPLIAVPTTAGTGSEVTHFAVVYVNGKKYSLASDNVRPDYAIIDSNMTAKLPPNITACSGFDAFSQAIESFWSVNSTSESKEFSIRAIQLIKNNIVNAVIAPTEESRLAMMKGAYFSGRAIDITKTTAPHALSYYLTSSLNIPHGHAVSILLGMFFEFNEEQMLFGNCNDDRGFHHINNTYNDLKNQLGWGHANNMKKNWYRLMRECGLEIDLKMLGFKKTQLRKLIENINFERLKNHPVSCETDNIYNLLLMNISEKLN